MSGFRRALKIFQGAVRRVSAALLGGMLAHKQREAMIGAEFESYADLPVRIVRIPKPDERVVWECRQLLARKHYPAKSVLLKR